MLLIAFVVAGLAILTAAVAVDTGHAERFVRRRRRRIRRWRSRRRAARSTPS